jgi:hypothetical protein
MAWNVVYSRRAAKLREKIPERVKAMLDALIIDIRATGPVRGDWPNYSKLSGDLHHCHLKKGQPTYVAVWRLQANEVHIVEIIYVGTHEKAPY